MSSSQAILSAHGTGAEAERVSGRASSPGLSAGPSPQGEGTAYQLVSPSCWVAMAAGCCPHRLSWVDQAAIRLLSRQASGGREAWLPAAL